MLISFGLPVAGTWAEPAIVGQVAARAEELGYHGLWTFQRLLVADGDRPDVVYRSVLDPMVTLGYAAALTSRIRLAVAVINLPYLSPVYLAKQASTLDVLSRGRAELTLGTGWSEVEFAATGSEAAPRGRRTEEYVAVLRKLFTAGVATFDGELYTVPPSRMRPLPVTPGGPPILLGGAADSALRRAGRIADGWVSRSAATLDDVRRGTQVVRRAAEEAGRDPDQVRIVARGAVRSGERDDARPLSGSVEQIRAGAELYAEAGVTELFYDLNWDPLIGGSDADPDAAVARAAELLEALAPSA
ncbi:TIGR03619 family F420-dependent LLM class oxidoreductase [Actinoplanes sp. NPDC049265]|uniref:TIGR03619 family F420-dependent LLM class oxidoreductase n=1 Tax=Actinoplanes sp. NPDC049265 TaxID=3363902 RepID=UPI003721858B